MVRSDRKNFWKRNVFPALLLVVVLLLPGALPGEASESVKIVGTDPSHGLLGNFFVTALEEVSLQRFTGTFRFSGETEALSKLRERVSSDIPEGYILSLSQLSGILPEALSLGMPFLFGSSPAVSLFFEESRYWELLRERCRQSLGMCLLGFGESGGFYGLFTISKEKEIFPDIKGLSCAISWEAEAPGPYAFGAVPVLFPRREEALEAFLRGGTEGGFFPLDLPDFSKRNEIFSALLLSHAYYELIFVLLPEEVWERFEREERRIFEKALEKANEEIRKIRQNRHVLLLRSLKEGGILVRSLSLKEEAPFASFARNVYARWLEEKISRDWIDLPLQEAQDANSMVEGQ